jgi:hypothetical protein
MNYNLPFTISDISEEFLIVEMRDKPEEKRFYPSFSAKFA